MTNEERGKDNCVIIYIFHFMIGPQKIGVNISVDDVKFFGCACLCKHFIASDRKDLANNRSKSKILSKSSIRGRGTGEYPLGSLHARFTARGRNVSAPSSTRSPLQIYYVS